MEPTEIVKYNASAEWMIPVFLIVLFVLSWVKNTYPKRFHRLVRAMFNQQSLFQVMREELVFSHRGSIALTFNFVVLSALFLTLSGIIFNFNFINQNDVFLPQFVYWGLFILLLYLVKWGINGMFLYLIQQPAVFKTYMFIVSAFNKIIGLILLPITILAAYLPTDYASLIIKTGFAFWAIMLFFRLIKEVSLSLSYKIPRLYIILYLCAFEISPFLIGLKLVNVLNI